MLGRDSTNHRFPEDGFDGLAFLVASQRQSRECEKLLLINRYHVKFLAEFAAQLRAMPDGDRNLLDHSLLYMGSTWEIPTGTS